MEFPIVYEDTEMLVLNKPPGVVVNRAISVKDATIQDWVDQRYDRPPYVGRPLAAGEELSQEEEFASRSGIVHRIDKETSGILLIAKTVHAFHALKRQFQERTVKKSYIALVHGNVVPETGSIDAPIDRLPWSPDRFGIVADGKPSQTAYTRVWYTPPSGVRSDTPHDGVSVVVFTPTTGRTHQIRVHAKYINHPLLGDYLYAGRKTSRSDRTWVHRVMLHAWKIHFFHPTLSTEMDCKAPIPEDMLTVFLRLGVPETCVE